MFSRFCRSCTEGCGDIFFHSCDCLWFEFLRHAPTLLHVMAKKQPSKKDSKRAFWADYNGELFFTIAVARGTSGA